MAEDKLKKVRVEKLKIFEEHNHCIYPYKFKKTHTMLEASALVQGTKNVSLAGRMMTFRDMGKLAFATISDFSGRMQIALQNDLLGKDSFKFFHKNFDMGDIVGVSGEIFITHKGETTLLVHKYELLAKGLLPLPEKWHGIQDKEVRYRKRYLDLIMNQNVVNTFKTRAKIISEIRRFLDEKGAIEVENPVLETVYGGAFARPFSTYLNALDLPVFLRISLELPLKKLLVGGFDWVYEMGRVFRNEGVDKSHNPEFTLLEWYKAYADFNDTMDITEELFKHLAITVLGETKFTYQDKEIDLKSPWKRIKMVDALKEYANIEVTKMSDEDLLEKCQELGLKLDKAHQVRGWLINELFEALCEDKLIEPTFITNHPIETTPFCKIDPEDKMTLQRFELYINGWEIANCYSELNDPMLQRKYLEVQSRALADGDEEANPMNEDYIEALEYGLPPNSGVGIGVDRLVMLLTDSSSIRDVIFNPMMKPESNTIEHLGFTNDKLQKTNKNTKLEAGISLQAARKLVKGNCDFSLERHCVAVSASMKALCEYFEDQDNLEFWEVAGLLHDIDWNKTINSPEEHCGEETVKLLTQEGCSNELIDVILSHYQVTNVSRDSIVKKALAACDELTGFIVACALVRPTKLDGMNSKSVIKKIKDKSFAAQVSRVDMKLCEDYFGISVNDFIGVLLPKINEIAQDYGLK